jgi:putative ABC transport system permease protein
MHGGTSETGAKRRRWRSRLRTSDLLSVGTYGLRGRKGRAALTAIGIAIGIAAIVSVFGISASSRADVLAQIDELGTDLLVVRAGNDVFGAGSHLPAESTAMVRRVGPVNAASAVSTLDTEVRRNRYMTTQNGLDDHRRHP